MTKRKLSHNNKTAKHGNSQDTEIYTDAVKVLRTVGDKEAFYFYEGIGKPTAENARNLNEFLVKVRTIKTESLEFHFQRKDFQNWIEEILGDAKLARELGRIPPSNMNLTRMAIVETIENRIRQLENSTIGTELVDAGKSIVVSAH
jgi:hypothetical protein